MRELLKSFGWRDVLDLGDITTARGAEMYMSLWTPLWGALGTPMFDIKVIRSSGIDGTGKPAGIRTRSAREADWSADAKECC